MSEDRDYNPQLDQRLQEMAHDEMDTIRMLFNTLPLHYGGVFGFVLFDSTGAMHTHYISALIEEQDSMNAAIGLMDIATRILKGQEESTDA